MAYSETLERRVREAFDARGIRYETKRMMGGLCFMVDEKMCVGIEKDRLMARIGPDAYEGALERKGCTPMDFTGRPMRGFVFVNANGLESAKELSHWLDLAVAYNPTAPQSKKRAK